MDECWLVTQSNGKRGESWWWIDEDGGFKVNVDGCINVVCALKTLEPMPMDIFIYQSKIQFVWPIS